MNAAHLAEMANHIAANLEAEPDHATAVETMRQHLLRFWEPRMRQQIIAHQRAGHADLVPLANDAVLALAQTIDTAAAGAPTDSNAAADAADTAR